MHCLRNSCRLISRTKRYEFVRKVSQTSSAWNLTMPQADDQSKASSPKLEQIVTEITKLNLLEVAELTSILKKRLNLPDAPAIQFAQAAVAASPAAASSAPEAKEEEEKPVEVTYSVKLNKFDEKQKIPLIKEIKNVMEGFNLVQAKKFVESVPAVVKKDISKEEAQKLKEALSKVGAEIEITS